MSIPRPRSACACGKVVAHLWIVVGRVANPRARLPHKCPHGNRCRWGLGRGVLGTTGTGDAVNSLCAECVKAGPRGAGWGGAK